MGAFDRSIFRERAIEKYLQRQELHTILRLASPSLFVCLWMLLLLALSGVLLIWYIRVPIVVSGEGLVIEQGVNSGDAGQNVVILLLLPPDQRATIHPGEPVSMSIDSTTGFRSSVALHGSIEQVVAGIMSPADIRSQFKLPSSFADIVSGPSVVAIARIEPQALADLYLGSQGRADVQTGTESVFPFNPDRFQSRQSGG